MRRKKSVIIAGIVCLVFAVGVLSFGGFAEAKVIKLKFANFFPPPAKQSKINQDFINALEERSGGRIKVQYFAGGSLLKAPAIYKGVESGIADIGYSHVYYTPGRMPGTYARHRGSRASPGLSQRLDLFAGSQ
ncbi:MAG: hypothetical protein JRJ82_02990 [Deltaproteobacteria bacterium]|nr:hypothetical protein [Deltaproteobacteria bacterium]